MVGVWPRPGLGRGWREVLRTRPFLPPFGGREPRTVASGLQGAGGVGEWRVILSGVGDGVLASSLIGAGMGPLCL